MTKRNCTELTNGQAVMQVISVQFSNVALCAP